MSGLDHTSRAHALLSASGASRWLKCTPSARLEEKFNESKTSVFAEEGTLAHEFGQINIQVHALVNQVSSKIYGSEIKKLRKHKLYSSEMEEEVQKYVDYVIETFNTVKQTCPDAILLVEERLDFSHLVEKGFGTGDICIIADGVLWVIDLKYGKGVKVDAKENSQLMLYGSGALRKFELMYDIHTVTLVIVQPRLDHIDEWSVTADQLQYWGEQVVKPKALMAYQGEGDQVAGSHCKFCKVKGMCRAFAEMNIDLAKHEFRDPYLLSDQEIADIHRQAPMLVDWAKGVSDHILSTAINGKQWPGLKIVEGRSNSKWTDEAEALDLLVREMQHKDLTKEDFTKTTLKGIGDVEKLVGKLWFGNAMGKYVVKPQGAPTLVDESDPRPAMHSIDDAKKDFQ